MDKLAIARAEYPELFELDADELADLRAELVDDMPDGDDARNWDGWDELAAIDEAIAAVTARNATEIIWNLYFEGSHACDIAQGHTGDDLAGIMRDIVAEFRYQYGRADAERDIALDAVDWDAMAARRIQLDSED